MENHNYFKIDLMHVNNWVVEEIKNDFCFNYFNSDVA